MKTLENMGSAKLIDSEQERIRGAADALFFAERIDDDPSAQAAVADITELRRHLIDSGRWIEETADTLLADVLACGPLVPVS